MFLDRLEVAKGTAVDIDVVGAKYCRRRAGDRDGWGKRGRGDAAVIGQSVGSATDSSNFTH